jgi:hypothetical protein
MLLHELKKLFHLLSSLIPALLPKKLFFSILIYYTGEGSA